LKINEKSNRKIKMQTKTFGKRQFQSNVAAPNSEKGIGFFNKSAKNESIFFEILKEVSFQSFFLYFFRIKGRN